MSKLSRKFDFIKIENLMKYSVQLFMDMFLH